MTMNKKKRYVAVDRAVPLLDAATGDLANPYHIKAGLAFGSDRRELIGIGDRLKNPSSTH